MWRQVLIPAAYPLSRVHRVIQAAMGWEDCHLHAFQIGKTSYGPDPEGELGYADETKARLADVARVRTRIGYEYDFGDGWEHELVVEARAVAEAGQIYPACIAGEGACPPEDCGGAYGFEELKEILAGPPSAERDEMLEWAETTMTPPASTWRRPTQRSRQSDRAGAVSGVVRGSGGRVDGHGKGMVGGERR